MTLFECPKCSGSTFVHSEPDSTYCLCAEPKIINENCATCGKGIEPMRFSALTKKLSTPKNAEKQSYAESQIGIKQAVQERADARTQNDFSKNISSPNDIRELIRAQNRTTHAVRAFVRFLFIQLSATTIAVMLWNLSEAFIDQEECFRNGNNCSGNGFLQFVAAVVLIGGMIWSSAAGWDELGKSKVE